MRRSFAGAGVFRRNLKSVHWLDALTKPMEGHIRPLIETLQNRADNQRITGTDQVRNPVLRGQGRVRRPLALVRINVGFSVWTIAHPY